MIRRVFKNLAVEEGAIPEASAALERDGYVVLRSVFDTATVHAIVDDIERVFDTFPAERSRPDRAPRSLRSTRARPARPPATPCLAR